MERLRYISVKYILVGQVTDELAVRSVLKKGLNVRL